MALKDPEYEQEGGTRIPLKAASKPKPKTKVMYNDEKKVALVYSANNGKTATGLFFHEADAIGSTLDSNGNSPAGAYVVPVEVWGTLENWKADQADKAKEALKARALTKLTPEEREVLGFK